MTVALAGFLGWMLWLAWPHEGTGDQATTATAASTLQTQGPGALPRAGVPCASYAPFRRRGHTPHDPALRVTPAQVREDLRALSTITRCVRTYGVDQGAEAVPAIARELGLQVVLGAWISRDEARNEIELSRALALAREHRDVVRLLVVGNEVLLRGEQTPQAMAALLARARAESAVPVTYADVWEFWLRHADALRDQVDTVTVHILPYWEDEPVGVGHAVGHVVAIAAHVRDRFGAQPVFIGETGWPAEGRQRGPARPGVAEQTRFVRELVAAQGRLPPLNLIEAFDQPWKRALEGAVGGQWGLFDAQGQPRVQLSGPIARPVWKDAVLVAAALGATLCIALAAFVAPRPGTGAARMAHAAAAALLGSTLLAAAAWQVHWLIVMSRTPVEWVINSAIAGIGAFGAVRTIGAWRTLPGPSVPHESAQVAAWPPMRSTSTACMLLVAAFTMLLWQLAWDGRYRALLWPLPMAAGLALATVLAWQACVEGAPVDATRTWAGRMRWMPAALAALALTGSACAAAIVWHEGLYNTQAVWLAAAWAAVLVAAAISVWHRAHPLPPPAAAPTGHAAASR